MLFKEYLEQNVISEINESSMTRDEFVSRIEKSFLKYFPNGELHSSGSALGGDKSIFFYGALGGWKVTRQNDPLSIDAWIHDGVDENGLMKDKITLEWNSSSLSVNPPEGSYLVMDSVKLGFRKKSGTPEQVLKAIDNSFKKAAKIVKENIDNIYGVDKIDSKHLVIKG